MPVWGTLYPHGHQKKAEEEGETLLSLMRNSSDLQFTEVIVSSFFVVAGSLAEDFKLIKPDELAKIVAVYNHILPSIYPHSHMLEDHYTGFDDLYDCTGYNTR